MPYFTAVAAATVLCLSAIAASAAWAGPTGPLQEGLRSSDRAAPAAAAVQDLRSPDLIAPATAPVQDLRAPDQGVSTGSVAPAAVVIADPAVESNAILASDDGGLSPLLIVLISVGGLAALAGAAYTARRYAHGHHPAAS